MANFASDKMFLSQTGVQVLIKKIADIRKEILDGQTGIANDFAELSALVDNIIAKTDAGVIAKGMLANVITLAGNLRNELGEVPVDATKTIYNRLADAEIAINELVDGDLTSDVNDLKAKAFGGADAVYDPAAQLVTIQFKDINGNVLEGKTATINTTDFIVHGMVQGVNIVTVDPNLNTAKFGAEDITVPDNIRADVATGKGDKYLVFRFKLAHDENKPTDSVHDSNELKDVWVNVYELFKDYAFGTESFNAEYITLEAAESGVVDGKNKVTFKVALGDAQKAVNDLVEGKAHREGNPTEKYRGVKDLNKDLDAEIAKREADKTAADGVKTTVDRLAEAVEAKDTGLLDRTTVVESRVDDLEQWTATQFLSPTWVEDYMEWTISGKTTEAPNPSDEKYKA